MKHLHSICSVIVFLLAACSASNCPLESTVTCNYGFYDRNGISISLDDTISVSTLLTGMKTIYVYRKLGGTTITTIQRDSNYLKAGYIETTAEVRRDTVLVNKLTKASSMKVPMQYFANMDTLILSYTSIRGKDTLYVQHDSYSFVDLPECGTHRFHNIRSVRSTDFGIDHVEVSNTKVDYGGELNIKIFFNGDTE